MAAHNYLINALYELTPDIPALSEESDDSVKKDRINWKTAYWLIDPLDGTKEFIKKNGEFTVNVALIENGIPIAGVIFAPALDTMYWGQLGQGAFKQVGLGPIESISVAPVPERPTGWRVLGSRSHKSPRLQLFMSSLPEAEILEIGSSLKLCLMAEGKADLYPRLSPTCEWDIAAGHAIVIAAGGQVLALSSLSPLVYNSNPDSLLNPFFVVCTKPSVFWENNRVGE